MEIKLDDIIGFAVEIRCGNGYSVQVTGILEKMSGCYGFAHNNGCLAYFNPKDVVSIEVGRNAPYKYFAIYLR